MRMLREVAPKNQSAQVWNDSTAMTPLPVTSAAMALASFASHAGNEGSIQSGMTVVLVDSVKFMFLVVSPQGSPNTSGLPGLSPPAPTRISSLVPAITVGAAIVFLLSRELGSKNESSLPRDE